MDAMPEPESEEDCPRPQTVVLLRAADRARLNSLAARESVSTGEIVRRALSSYQPLEARIRRDEEESIIRSALGLLHEALLTTNESMTNTLAKLDTLHQALSKFDPR